jgi:hypothetical protein
MTPTRSTRRPPYRLAAVMIAGLVVVLAVQLVVQVPKAVAAVQTPR